MNFSLLAKKTGMSNEHLSPTMAKFPPFAAAPLHGHFLKDFLLYPLTSNITKFYSITSALTLQERERERKKARRRRVE